MESIVNEIVQPEIVPEAIKNIETLTEELQTTSKNSLDELFAKIPKIENYFTEIKQYNLETFTETQEIIENHKKHEILWENLKNLVNEG